MPDYQLRPAAPDDADVLFRIHWASMSDYLARALGGYTDEDARAYHRQWLRSGRVQVIVVGEQAAGALDVDWQPDTGFLRTIEIDPAFQRRGIGTAIVRDLLDQCAQRRTPARLYVFPHNPAGRLYQRLGFREVDRDGPYIVMQWDPPGRGTCV
jgi:ribosomal protein S18 acetylase RimI-like enzyme